MNINDAILDPTYKFLVCFSGGKDSIAMFLGLLNLGVDKSRIVLHHHEVDGGGENFFDWKATTSYCKKFAESFGVDILFSYREGGIAREIYRENEGLQSVYYQKDVDGDFIELKSRKGSSTRRKFPAVSGSLCSRWCSSVAKIDVLSRVITNNDEYNEGNFIVCTGERAEESTKRASYVELEKYRAYSQKRNIWQWRPILDWKEGEVWSIIEAYGVQVHPVYELGWGRCSCQTCIFSSANTWAAIAELSPEKIDKIEAIEKDIDFTLYSKTTIREKVEKGTSFLSAELVDTWASEALETFTKPIFVENWTLPAGAFATESAGVQ